MAVEGRAQGPLVWLAAALPLVPLVIAHVMEAPPAHDEVVSLAGAWQLREVADDGAVFTEVPRLDDGGPWRVHMLPSGWSRSGVHTTRGWLLREVTLPPSLTGRDLFLMVPNIRGGLARIYVNGELVGDKGIPDADIIVEETAHDGYMVPASLIKREGNVVAVDVRYPSFGHDGFPDARWLLGSPTVVKTYLSRIVGIKHVLEHGAMMLNVVGIAMMLALLRLRSGDRQLHLAALAMMSAVTLYLVAKTGVPASFFMKSSALNDLITYSVVGIALATPELIEAYYARRRTLFRVINRGVCALTLIVSIPFGINPTYQVFSLWLFAVIVHALFFALRDLVKPKTTLGPVLASAMVCTAFSAGNDLINDLDVFYTVRLFAFAVGNLGVVAVVLVLGELLIVSRALSAKNAELVDALQRAEESARLKSEFLANTSHELRTPLNAILNIPQGLLDEIEERSIVVCSKCTAMFEADDADSAAVDGAGGGAALEDPCPSCGARAALHLEVRKFAPDDAVELERHLRGVIGAGRHLLAVVDDILDFSKLDAGRMKLNISDVAVADVIERAVATVSPIATEAGVTIAAPPAPALIVQGDGTRLAQVLINLVANAVKFSPKGAVVDVEAVSHHANSAVIFRVRDRGPGIAPEHHAMIFESFRQVEGGHTRKHGGTGLGLAIVKKIVELHGGSVAVESALGRGATFTVQLPLRAPAKADPAALPGADGTTSTPA